MTVVAITGTPGTGKSSICKELKGRGFEVLEIAELIRKLGIKTVHNDRYDSDEVDTEELRGKVDEYIASMKNEALFVSGHLSHFVTCSTAVVLRTDPHVLYARLEARGWRKEKILENVRAEILDVILVEAAERINDLFELDTTRMKPRAAAAKLLEAISRRPESMRPGRIDWTGGIEEWF